MPIQIISVRLRAACVSSKRSQFTDLIMTQLPLSSSEASKPSSAKMSGASTASSSSSRRLLFSPAVKHALFCVSAPVWIIAFCVATGAITIDGTEKEAALVDPWLEYGYFPTLLLMLIR